ncbi:MAG: ATP-binding protein [Clostridia bacterium]|nr:ATP-binding protein [Clostridia bacterium]
MTGKSNTNIREAVMSELASRRIAAQRLKTEREEYLIKNIPGYESVSEDIRKYGIALGRLALKGRNSDEYADAQEKLNALIEKKKQIVSEYENYLTDVYTCGICEDRGYYTENGNTVMCRCYKSILTEKLMESYGIISDMGTFDTFDISLYPETADEKEYGVSAAPRNVIKNTLRKCREFVENFDNEKSKNMLFVGKTGVGKSFMCNCIAYELVKKGVPVLYVSAPALLSKATMIAVNEEQNVNKQEFCNLVRSVDLLIIDDLGTEKQSDAKYQELLEILNERIRGYSRGLRTVISTNLSPKNI